MTGPESATEEELGVNFRALNDLFHISRSRGDTVMYDVSVQMIEIYNEQIRDLLGSNGSEKKLGILNASHPNGLAVPDATIHPVNSTSDVIELMRTGLGNRAVGATALNERSSRSHSVVTVHIQGEDLKTGATLRGALHLVDLAGSERVDRSAVTGDRLKEAQHINKSLSALGDVIFSLSQKTSHVPYRNSKLTQVLQSSLGGHAKTLMFVQIKPDVSSYAESLSTLRFAERVSGVELGAAKVNKEGKDIREFKEQLSMLKYKIAKKDEEINQLQTHTPRAMTGKRADSLLKHSSYSSGISYLGGKIQHRRTASGGKALGFVSRGSDADNFSEISDKRSEARSMQSVDDTHHQSEIMAAALPPRGRLLPRSRHSYCGQLSTEHPTCQHHPRCPVLIAADSSPIPIVEGKEIPLGPRSQGPTARDGTTTASGSPASASPSPPPPSAWSSRLRRTPASSSRRCPSSKFSHAGRADAAAASATAASPHVSASAMAPSSSCVVDVLGCQVTREILHGSMTLNGFPSVAASCHLLGQKERKVPADPGCLLADEEPGAAADGLAISSCSTPRPADLHGLQGVC